MTNANNNRTVYKIDRQDKIKTMASTTTPSTTPECWVNNVAPRATPRLQRDTVALLTTVPKDKRGVLPVHQNMKLKT